MEQYPSNSRSNSTPTPPEKEEVKKVVTGPVTFRKKTLGRKFLEVFIGDGKSPGVWDYIVKDVLVPAMQETVVNAVKGGIDQAIYGRSDTTRVNRFGGGGYRDYNSISRGTSIITRRDDNRREPDRLARPSADFDTPILGTRGEALHVLDMMNELLSQYKLVTVADLYSLLGRPSTHIEQGWGWDDLRGSDVQHIHGGFLLDLPRPKVIE